MQLLKIYFKNCRIKSSNNCKFFNLVISLNLISYSYTSFKKWILGKKMLLHFLLLCIPSFRSFLLLYLKEKLITLLSIKPGWHLSPRQWINFYCSHATYMLTCLQSIGHVMSRRFPNSEHTYLSTYLLPGHIKMQLRCSNGQSASF